MTLHTRIYVEAPYPRKDGFDAALAAICEAAGKPVPSVHTHEGSWGDLAWHMTNRGQGLPGVVICHYRHDAPLAIDDEHDEHGDLIPAEMPHRARLGHRLRVPGRAGRMRRAAPASTDRSPAHHPGTHPAVMDGRIHGRDTRTQTAMIRCRPTGRAA